MFKNLRAYGNILRAYGHILRAYGDQTPLITATSAPIETGHPPCICYVISEGNSEKRMFQ